jgi:uncharacterized coiled-coil DUF342 family protein
MAIKAKPKTKARKPRAKRAAVDSVLISALASVLNESFSGARNAVREFRDIESKLHYTIGTMRNLMETPELVQKLERLMLKLQDIDHVREAARHTHIAVAKLRDEMAEGFKALGDVATLREQCAVHVSHCRRLIADKDLMAKEIDSLRALNRVG